LPSWTWVNIGGTWRRVKRLWSNVGGTWRETTVGSTNISGTWRTSHRKFYFPANCVIPMWANIGTLPSPWSQYGFSPTLGYMPIGVNTWGLGVTASSGPVTLTSGNTANHTGGLYAGFSGDGVSCQVEYYACTTANGAHGHTVYFDPNNTIPKVGPCYITPSSNTYTMPQYGMVFGYGTQISSTGISLVKVNFGAHYFLAMNPNTTLWSQGGTWTGSAQTTSSYTGHDHRGTLYYCSCWTSPYNMYLHLAGQGGHSHSVTIGATNIPQCQAVGAYGNWTDNTGSGGYGAMIMYPSATSPPGYSLCNGTNGTPQMADQFLYIKTGADYGGYSGGSFYPTWGGTTNNAGSHQHQSGLYPYYVLTSNHYHSNLLGNEQHSFYDARWWAPALWGMYWHMWTG